MSTLLLPITALAIVIGVIGVIFLLSMRTSSSPAAAKVKTSEGAQEKRRVNTDYINTYTFPAGMLDRALAHCPRRTNRTELERGLRQFLIAAGEAALTGQGAGMPSKTVDEGWHEFILYTRPYADFCTQAYGSFLHHEPEVAMTSTQVEENQTAAMARTWDSACRSEGFDAHSTTTAPALFRSDVTAGVSGAKKYLATCGSTTGSCAERKGTVCVAHQLRHKTAAQTNTWTQPPASAPAASRKRATSTEVTTGSGSGGQEWLTTAVLASAVDTDSGSSHTSGHDNGSHSSCGSSSASCGSSSSSCGSSSSSCGSSCGSS